MEKTTTWREISVRTGRGMRTDIDARSHHLVADEPVDLGGSDQGPAPYDLLLASLGACTAITLRMYADRKGWPLTGIGVRVRHRQVTDADPANPPTGRVRSDVFETELELTGDLDAEQRARLLEIAGRCPVKRTLEGRISLDTRLAGG